MTGLPALSEYERGWRDGASEALTKAAEECAAALMNEVGSGHTSTYSVRRWLLGRAREIEGGD